MGTADATVATAAAFAPANVASGKDLKKNALLVSDYRSVHNLAELKSEEVDPCYYVPLEQRLARASLWSRWAPVTVAVDDILAVIFHRNGSVRIRVRSSGLGEALAGWLLLDASRTRS